MGCGGVITLVQANHLPSRDPFHVEQSSGGLSVMVIVVPEGAPKGGG